MCIGDGLGAARLLLLTDVPGVLNKQGELLTDLTPADIHRLRDDGTISGGMIPKSATFVQPRLSYTSDAADDPSPLLLGRRPDLRTNN